MLRFRPNAAPKRFVFVDPDTKHAYSAKTKKELFLQIVNYRAQNRHSPIEALDLVLENYWCSLPENLGSCESVKLRRGFMQTIRGGIALVQNYFYGEDKIAPQAVAESRALTCLTCNQNQFPDREFYEIWADEIAEHSTRGRKTALHSELGNCVACSCPLRAKVFYKGPFELSEKEKSEMKAAHERDNPESPVHCWQLEGE